MEAQLQGSQSKLCLLPSPVRDLCCGQVAPTGPQLLWAISFFAKKTLGEGRDPSGMAGTRGRVGPEEDQSSLQPTHNEASSPPLG